MLTYPQYYQRMDELTKLGSTEGTWVLVCGITKERPYHACYHATQLLYDGEGDLYPDHTGPVMDYHKITGILLCDWLIQHIAH